MLRLFKSFFNKKFNIFLETFDSSILYQKNWKTSYLPLLLWVLSLKKKSFSGKIIPNQAFSETGC